MKLRVLLKRSSQNGQGPVGKEAPEKLSNEILKWMSKSCHVDVSNMLRSLERWLLTESLESQLKSTDLALFIQTMPEISAAPYQCEKGQLPVLASADSDTQIPGGFCRHRRLPVWCPSPLRNRTAGRQRSLIKSTEFIQTFAVAFFSKVDGIH